MNMRQRLHKRWVNNKTDGFYRIVMRQGSKNSLNLLDKYNHWHVDKFTEYGPEPWYLIPVSRFVSWCCDWETTWAARPWGEIK